MTREEQRLEEARKRTAHWRRWGPYLSDRQWGTVREDYSADGDAWDYFTHEQARSRAYRWGEDGILGISDNHQRLCFALALWNERDPMLKERYFGLTGSQGNHGEDVKDYYFYVDNTPTHSYMRGLYKYPQAAFPYERLVDENRARGRHGLEYELLDTGAFDGGRYWDVFVEYAKAGPEDLLIRVTAANRGDLPATLHLLPTLWFRNTWSWDAGARRPRLGRDGAGPEAAVIAAHPEMAGPYRLVCEGAPALLFTENESNARRLFRSANPSPYVKDAFHECVIGGNRAAVNPAEIGTKAAAHYRMEVGAGESAVVRLRLTAVSDASGAGAAGEAAPRPARSTSSTRSWRRAGGKPTSSTPR